MKKILKNILGGFINKRFYKLAHNTMIKLPKGSKVFIFDLDNTLADTFGQKHLTDVAHFPKMIELVKQKITEGPVYFLTARNITTYKTTKQWLQNRGFSFPNQQLLFVTEPHHKIALLHSAIAKGLQIEYYDDLSYNHEKGEVKYFDEVIKVISSLPISYKGINDFKHLQQ